MCCHLGREWLRFDARAGTAYHVPTMTARARTQETRARSMLSGRPVGRDSHSLGLLDLLLLAR